jgi:serine acetyltransferase
VGVLVGAGAKILPGLSVGDGAIIGAGAVVTANVNAGETWVGVPARNTARS